MRKPGDPFRVLIDGLLFAGGNSLLLAIVIVIGEWLSKVF